MPKINVLDKQTAELIAAGEVVERPASAIKEMVENSIDAGATRITVEIEGGGITMMRVTDNGCGISWDDVEKAFLRHATSKISKGSDLDSIGTLGFRGEALAAISTVSRVSMITRTENEEMGTRYIIDGGEEVLKEEIGCSVGTIIEVRDLFYNTPARMKFLKKDMKEGANVAATIDRIALSHPEVAFELIKDGKRTLTTQGNGNLKDATYSVLGREIALGTVPLDYTYEGVRVHGLICKPFKCRPNRNLQLTFLNGRFIKSKTAMAALDVGYKNSAMVGKFPYCVLNIEMPYEMVDVNVHPAKTEVRFANENLVFDAIRFGVKQALEGDISRPEIKAKPNPQVIKERMSSKEFLEILAAENKKPSETAPLPISKPYTPTIDVKSKPNSNNFVLRDGAAEKMPEIFPVFEEKPKKADEVSVYNVVEAHDSAEVLKSEPTAVKEEAEPIVSVPLKSVVQEQKPLVEPRFIGEAFKTYIIAELDDKLYLIDKHATHERILFEKQREARNVESQLLLTPITVTLTKQEHSAIIENADKLAKAGFDIDDFGDGALLIREVPSLLSATDFGALLSEIAESLLKTNSVMIEKLDRIYHTVACKAAVKAGNTSSDVQLRELMMEALTNPKIRYCPHGRPVAIELSEKELEKMFGRLG